VTTGLLARLLLWWPTWLFQATEAIFLIQLMLQEMTDHLRFGQFAAPPQGAQFLQRIGGILSGRDGTGCSHNNSFCT
jgi:hypothetical protein